MGTGSSGSGRPRPWSVCGGDGEKAMDAGEKRKTDSSGSDRTSTRYTTLFCRPPGRLSMIQSNSATPFAYFRFGPFVRFLPASLNPERTTKKTPRRAWVSLESCRPVPAPWIFSDSVLRRQDHAHTVFSACKSPHAWFLEPHTRLGTLFCSSVHCKWSSCCCCYDVVNALACVATWSRVDELRIELELNVAERFR